MENPIQVDDLMVDFTGTSHPEVDENWGYSYFRKPPYLRNVRVSIADFFQRLGPEGKND